ncbi:glycosyltransferase [Fibrobacter sp.]|uniref:glycosyltransferase n=1 Tax=Fibrobacter sp. TaxID=35828 RepID=UPI0025BA7EF8|nr:glycosyltransferase [Fibrobacter sp.]MBR3071081.1 glycosyltransferase [Fibrobacter sp.]
MPAISVIIPMYNTEAFIKDCLDSLVAQTFTDFEAIIIDDGSTDESTRIAASYASSDSRFRVIGQPNKGVSEARNTGLKIMRGEYVTFVDSDDCVAPNFLETLFYIARLHQADIACCSIQNINETYKENEVSPDVAKLKNTTNSAWLTPEKAFCISLYQDSLPDYSAWNKLYKAALWKNKQFPVGTIYEDLAIIPDILLIANKVAITKAKLYLYRKRLGSELSTQINHQKIIPLLGIAEDVFEKAKSKPKPLYKAARSMLLSASFSILMRTEDSEEFAEYRKKALEHIRKYRFGTFFDWKIRMRNRMAILISYLPRSLFFKFLKKGMQ